MDARRRPLVQLSVYPHGDQFVSDDILTRLGHPAARTAMRTPHFTSAPLLLSGTDNLILLPSLLAGIFAKSAPVVEIALHADAEFGYRLIWHERTQKAPGISWVRAQICELVPPRKTSNGIPCSRENSGFVLNRHKRPISSHSDGV